MYNPLPSDGTSIRLLRLLPSSRKRSKIECELFEANTTNTDNVPFEALSYTWGDATKTVGINLDGVVSQATVNLEAALRALRKPDQPRIFWVDAVCINQNDVREQSEQVRMMWNIYKAAERVVVWLGPEEGDSATAMVNFTNRITQTHLELLETTKREKPENFEGTTWCNCNGGRFGLRPPRIGFRGLIGRQWFTRVWVLQEVAAAKEVVVACGDQLVPGDDFYREVIGVSGFYTSYQKMIRKIRPAVELMSPSATVLQKHSVPLLELIEKYRSWNATKAVDKVYALLNFSSDAYHVQSLQPDYGISEHELARRIVQFAFPGCVIGEETDSKCNAITFEVEGHILGKICMKQSGRGNGRTWSFKSRDLSASDKSDFTDITLSPKISELIEGGDITLLNERRLSFGYVCYLRGSSRPAVLDFKNGAFQVVMLATPTPAITRDSKGSSEPTAPERTWTELLPLLNNETEGMTKFKLTWDPFRQPTGTEVSSYLPTPNNPEIQWEARLECMKEQALKKRAEGQLEDVHTCHTLVELDFMYDDERANIKAGKSKYTITIHEAASEEWLDTLKLLLDANAPVDERDDKGLTALHRAAFVGNAEIVKVLLQAKATVNVEHEEVGTPLSIALLLGHEKVCRLLLLAGAKPLPRAKGSSPSVLGPVIYENFDAVKSLLDSGTDPNITEEVGDMKGVTPLHMAAEMGHLKIAELLTERGAKI